MGIPNNWKIEEILSLTYYKKASITLIRSIIEKFDSINELLHPSNDNEISAKFRQDEIFGSSNHIPLEEAKKQIELCKKNCVSIIGIWDESYPLLMNSIYLPPLFLFVKGKLQASDSLSISIVGTRTNSMYGKLMAEEFASYFAQNGIIITSGLAFGIDTISHISTIESKGTTYAVLGCGIDTLSSSYQVKNADKIVDSGGAVISEFKCGITAKPGYFSQRNRIISGISKATLVVESDIQGGSMITAKFAFDQGREVFAIPGNIKSQKSKGTNYLIKKNIATIALSPQDILEDLGLSAIYNVEQKQLNIDKNEMLIYRILSHEPMHIDEIANNLNSDVTDISVKLLTMEFNGIVKQLPGKHYIKAM